MVLAARKIDPGHDSVYFRFILQLQGVSGRDIYDRFMVLLAVGPLSLERCLAGQC